MELERMTEQFGWKAFKRWRLIQIAALLPLILTGILMLYFKQASGLGIVAFFLILIIGILMPQVRADLALSHLTLAKEIEEGLERVKEELLGLLQERLGPPVGGQERGKDPRAS